MKNSARFNTFIEAFSRLIDEVGEDEARIFEKGRELLAILIRRDDWLAGEYAQPHPDHYQQYLLYCDPEERFSVVSFVWGPAQKTPIHDHTVWGMIGVLRGIEDCQEYSVISEDGKLEAGEHHQLAAGEIDLVSPTIGDIHQVSNALEDKMSISIHVYGGNIGVVRRHIYEASSGNRKTFISGYSDTV